MASLALVLSVDVDDCGCSFCCRRSRSFMRPFALLRVTNSTPCSWKWRSLLTASSSDFRSAMVALWYGTNVLVQSIPRCQASHSDDRMSARSEATNPSRSYTWPPEVCQRPWGGPCQRGRGSGCVRCGVARELNCCTGVRRRESP